ncbi:MAG: prolipoprotein diacylglyceryl transferase [Chloroflexota bacterium]
MPGIVINIDPVAFTLGGLAVRWYGLAIVAAILAGFSLALSEARRRGLNEDAVANLGLAALVCAIVGARLAHVVDHLGYYLSAPLSILALNEGGLSIFGGVLGGLFAAVVFASRARLPLWRVLDVAAPGLILGQIIGRLGCIVNGDAQGLPADLPWAFTYIHPDALAPELGLPGHPYPVYEMLWNLAGLALLWSLRTRLRTPGALFLVYAAYYSLGRFFLSFVRQETQAFWGLQQAQVIALASLVLAGLAALYLLRQRPVALSKPSPQG